MTFQRCRPVWIHIDHIDNKGGKVWAVQVPSRRKYFTCHHIQTYKLNLQTRYRKTQPRAYLVGKARHVRITDVRGRITIEVYGA